MQGSQVHGANVLLGLRCRPVTSRPPELRSQSVVLWFVTPTMISSLTSNTVAAHLGPWGYVLSGVGEAYRNFEAGGYWGIADFFRHLGILDKCVEEGGKWSAAVITHYRLGSLVTTQNYVGPDGYTRRVSKLAHMRRLRY